jgi:hypothetical protein
MSWQRYDLGFRLLSPLHVGAGRVGNLQRTRRYVHGKAVWAALTARLTHYASGRACAADYVRVGAQVKERFRFGYLFVASECGKRHWPWEMEFDYRFLSSYASTALTAANAGAEMGALHETEFIGNFSRPIDPGGHPEPVYLAGDLWVHHDGIPGWDDALRSLTIGGERGYGWGRLERTFLVQAGPPKDEASAAPVAGCAIAHVRALGARNVRGPVEAVVGWERDNDSATGVWRVSRHTLCYAPGAIVTGDTHFRVGEDGIWECLT